MPPASLPALAAMTPGPMTARYARSPRRRATARCTRRPPRRHRRRPAARTLSARTKATRRLPLGRQKNLSVGRRLARAAQRLVLVPALFYLATQLLQTPHYLDLLFERQTRQSPPAFLLHLQQV